MQLASLFKELKPLSTLSLKSEGVASYPTSACDPDSSALVPFEKCQCGSKCQHGPQTHPLLLTGDCEVTVLGAVRACGVVPV